jgi:RimJ/RimL family protein N-acetyltransferase
VSERAIWLEAALKAVPSRVLAWRGPEAVRTSLESWLDLQLKRITNPGFGEGFAQGCPWEGAEPADYQQRFVGFPGGEALVGIRFLGGSPEFRFVDLVITRGAEDPTALAAAGRAALEACSVFAPHAIRVRQAAERTLDPSGWRAEADQHFLVGRLDELAARLPAVGEVTPADLALEPVSPEDAAAFTSQAYAAWSETAPELGAKVRPSDLDELRDCHDTGLLVWIVEAGQRAGVIGFARSEDAELVGYLVEEEVIALPFRGRRLASAAQALAIRALAAREPSALLFGTIDAANAPSLRTAERAGRSRVASYRFLFPPPE